MESEPTEIDRFMQRKEDTVRVSQMIMTGDLDGIEAWVRKRREDPDEQYDHH